MNARRIGTSVGKTLAYGLGYGKARRKLDRPTLSSYETVYDNVVRLGDEPKEEKATSSVYFYSNMRVLAQKMASAEMFVKIRDGERTEHVDNHPFERRFRRPNPLFSRADLMEHSMWWLGLNGNAYWYLTVYDNELVEIWPMPANEIEPIAHKTQIISHYRWRPGGRKMPPIPVKKICHFRMINPYNVLKGASFLDALNYTLEGSDARFQWELDFFGKQRAMPEGMLSLAADTEPDDVQRIREELKQTYAEGRRGFAVGRAGAMTFTRFTLTQEEMAFLERLKYDEKLFDRVFGFPGGYWDAKANRANAEQAERSLAQDTVMPMLGRFAGNMEVQILEKIREQIRFDSDAKLSAQIAADVVLAREKLGFQS